MKRLQWIVLAVAAAWSSGAHAGPPYASDDPEPTDKGHYEIYLFTQGSSARDAISGSSGIDFNYGAGDDLQLTAVLPVEYERPGDAHSATGIGNIELGGEIPLPAQTEYRLGRGGVPAPAAAERVRARRRKTFVAVPAHLGGTRLG